MIWFNFHNYVLQMGEWILCMQRHTLVLGIHTDTIKPYIKESERMKNTGFRVMVSMCDRRQEKELVEGPCSQRKVIVKVLQFREMVS